MSSSPENPPFYPEQFHIHNPTRHVPNSRLPVLVYRCALELCATDNDGGELGSSGPVAGAEADTLATERSKAMSKAKETIERNHWLHGGTFKTYRRHHFHSVTHECYAVVSGRSKLLLGTGPLDQGKGVWGEDQEGNGEGVEVEVGKGDVIVLPVRELFSMKIQGCYFWID